VLLAKFFTSDLQLGLDGRSALEGGDEGATKGHWTTLVPVRQKGWISEKIKTCKAGVSFGKTRPEAGGLQVVK